MTVAVRSFAKINLGLYVGAARADGYHDLRTVYQTIALHDVIRISGQATSQKAREVAHPQLFRSMLRDNPR